jgi:HAD superfamily hydrolase (TIGR01509 family)
MKKFSAIIFDMDGTIVDTSSIWDSCNRYFLLQKNIYSEELLNQLSGVLHGVPLSGHVEKVKKVCGLEHEKNEDIINEYAELVKKYYELEIKYIKEFEKFITTLLGYNIPVAIATNSCDYGIIKVNNIVNLRKYFGEHIYGIACVAGVPKPAPDIYLYAAKKLQVDPQECIVFEDSLHGITAAKNALMYTVAINTAHIDPQLIHADKIISCYSEFLITDYFGL